LHDGRGQNDGGATSSNGGKKAELEAQRIRSELQLNGSELARPAV
jgi:hypothetical protein